MCGQHHVPAAFTPGKDPVPIVQEAGWAPEPVWIGAENLAPPGFDPRNYILQYFWLLNTTGLWSLTGSELCAIKKNVRMWALNKL
jgi:hypothetical protein